MLVLHPPLLTWGLKFPRCGPSCCSSTVGVLQALPASTLPGEAARHTVRTSSPITCPLKNVVQLVHGKRQAESKLVPHQGEAGRGSCWLLSSASLIF